MHEEASLKDVLKNLKLLQLVDTQLRELESTRGDLPQRVEQLKQELDVAEKLCDDNEKQFQDTQKERALLEVEIKSLQEKKSKYQDQLYQVKNNREYDAITFEIEAIKNTISDNESKIIELLDKEEKLSKAIEESKESFEKIKGSFEENHSQLKDRMAETEKEEASLHDQRGKIIRNVPPRILSTYDRTRKAKNGQGVVNVYKNACGGCFKALPPQKVLEIRQMDQMILCEVCGRILVWDEKISEEQ